MARLGRANQLHRNVDMGPAGAQRVLAPEPELHRHAAEPQTGVDTDLSPSGRELLLEHDQSLLKERELLEFDGGE
jgi:hypothetical protein